MEQTVVWGNSAGRIFLDTQSLRTLSTSGCDCDLQSRDWISDTGESLSNSRGRRLSKTNSLEMITYPCRSPMEQHLSCISCHLLRSSCGLACKWWVHQQSSITSKDVLSCMLSKFDCEPVAAGQLFVIRHCQYTRAMEVGRRYCRGWFPVVRSILGLHSCNRCKQAEKVQTSIGRSHQVSITSHPGLGKFWSSIHLI